MCNIVHSVWRFQAFHFANESLSSISRERIGRTLRYAITSHWHNYFRLLGKGLPVRFFQMFVAFLNKLMVLVVYLVVSLILLIVTLFSFSLYEQKKLKYVSATALKVLEARIALAKQGRRKDGAAIKLVESSLWHLHFNSYVATVRDYLFNLFYKMQTMETNLFITRFAFFDEQLLHELHDDSTGILQQIVLLGGGFDTTLFKPEVVAAVRVKGVRLFEVDRRPTQKFKREVTAAAGLDTQLITYVTCDFMEENWLDCLKQAGFDVTKKTYILWEGVTYYLDTNAVSVTLQLFADNCTSGSTINFDVCDNLNKVPWLLRASLRWINEPWLFGLTCTEHALQSWSECFGLEVKRMKIIKDRTLNAKFAIMSVVKPNCDR